MDDRVEKNNAICQESLQPQRINKDEKAYQGVFDIEYRLRKGDATNIALTGPYGSGKSSILISLKEDFPQYHYLNISLATLKPNAESDIGNSEELSKLNIDRLIEYSILQQLIYKEKQTTLPNSRFKRIFQLPKESVVKITYAILIAVIAVIIVLEPSFLQVEWLCKLFGKNWMNIVGDTASILYLLWFAYKTISIVIPAISNSRLNKFNLKDGEIEIVENTSIFNKHLDEILYFFEQTDYNVVLLEDLDRFETTDIFLKLRELNLLLNESKVVGRKIFFIYAVRDDMFQDAERVKCFDYVTTVIPIINRSNAKDQLIEELEKRGVTEIKHKDLKELGFFLNDMRLLKNIANEYVQYREKLAIRIGPEKLLAMIIYKNYYPQDFARLHNCDGTVYKLLNLKGTFISTKLKEIEDEEKKWQEKRIKHQKEMHLKEEELRRIYVEAYRDKIGNNAQKLKIEETFHTFPDIAKSETLFDKLRAKPNVTYSYTTYYYSSPRTQTEKSNITFTDIEKAVDATMSYRDRLESLRSNFDALDIKNENESKKDDIRSLSISKIMSEVNYSDYPAYKELKVPRMIEFFVAKGYIDENYYDYISYFYGNFIDAHDWDFVLDVKLGRARDYDYLIDNVEVCLTEIPNSAYYDKAILNIYIVDYFAIKKYDRLNERRLQVVLRTIVENKKYDFLTAYYLNGHQQDFVFGMFFSLYKDLWEEFVKNDDSQNHLKVIWYKYAEKEQSCEQSREWLSENYDFITENLIFVDEKQWFSLIERYPYKFKNLNELSGTIIEKVVERNAFELSKKNVETIISCLSHVHYESVSYRLVLETENETLIKRVEETLENCMKTVFSLPESENESITSIVKILKSDKVSVAEKINYLRRQQNKLDLTRMEDVNVKSMAFKCDVAEATWNNVIDYISHVSDNKVDVVLKAFIEKYVDLMIEEGRIPYSVVNTGIIKETCSVKAQVAYLLKNKKDFLADISNVGLTTEIAQRLMRAELTMEEKALIVPCMKAEILNGELANEVLSVMQSQVISIDDVLFLKSMSLSSLTEYKITVMGHVLNSKELGEDIITDLLNTLPEPYKFIAEKGKKPEIPSTEGTRRLVGALKEKGYISTFSETAKGIRVNTRVK